MPTAVTGAFAKLKAFVAGFTVVQKTFAIILTAAVVLGAIALGSWLMKPQMSPLFTGMSASDANAVVEQLEAAGVPYELADGGASVLVPRAEVYPQRLAAASEGLPGDTSGGYSLLDEMGVTSSEFQQSVTYKRAVEGEIARTLTAMDGIDGATVQLAIPEESVFVSEQRVPTASIFVETAAGKELSRSQVDAIVHLASSAVTGMELDGVSVVDQNGKVLSAAGVGTAGSANEQAGEYEAKVSANVQRMLDQVLGSGNSTVTVAADVSRSTSELVDEQYEPVVDEDGNPIMSSEQEQTETYQGTGGQGTGVLGPDNIAVPEGAGDGQYESSDATRNNALNRVTERVETPSGGIERQTVSVAVDDGVMADAGVAVADVEEIVAAAAGINEERGDAVTVASMPFSTADADAAAAALAQADVAAEQARTDELIRSGIIAAAIALPLLILALILGVRRRKSRRYAGELAPVAETALVPAGGGTADRQEPETILLTEVHDEIESAADPVEPDPDPAPKASPDQVMLERERFELEQSVRRDPERAAESLRTLMMEGSPR